MRENKVSSRYTNADTRVYQNKAVNDIQKERFMDNKWSDLQEDVRSIDSVIVKSFSINSLKCIIVMTLETNSKHTRCQIL